MVVANQPHSLFTAPSVFRPPTVLYQQPQQAATLLPPPPPAMIPEEDTLELVLSDPQKWAKIESEHYHNQVNLSDSPFFQILR